MVEGLGVFTLAKLEFGKKKKWDVNIPENHGCFF